MFIKSLIIDGFKSYGKRTEVNGFDPEFTAITGLNGTGKSNVLDAICFVLGISNLSHVRATSLQELVYKGGQCGVTKATVTIIFDNTNPLQSPIGYEKCREITVARQVIVGGKNKYMINGKVVINKKVGDLFCSVQLNINNPNFLIMQGRITKVLNMKPEEVSVALVYIWLLKWLISILSCPPVQILSMIEEAAGTSMYESKRDETNKLLERKDGKMNEISSLLHEEIEPKLDKLRAERDRYVEFQQLVREIEHLMYIHVSHTYLQHKKAVESCETSIRLANEFIETGHQQMITNDATVEQLDADAQQMQARIDAESGGELTELEARLAELTRSESAQTGEKKSTEAGLAVEKRNILKLQRSIKDDEQALERKQNEMGQVAGLFEQLKSADETDKEALATAKRHYEAVRDGLSTNADGEAASLQDQLMQAKQQAMESSTCIKTTDMARKQNAAKLRQLQGQRKTTDAAYVKDQQAAAHHQREVERLQAALDKLDYTDGSLEQLDHRRRQLQTQRRDVQSRFEQRNGHRYEFHYRDPEPNFDRSRVRGMACMLFEVRNERDYLALGMAAGGSLYSVVTDTDVTSKMILQNGQLQQRTTMIPINKISAGSLSAGQLEAARQAGGADNVWHALDLIEYDPSVEKVMRFLFGRTLICRNIEVAKKVTYHPRVMCRSVTLEGDIVDPQGTLSGGARPKGGAVLAEIADVRRLVAELRQNDEQIAELSQQMQRMQRIAQAFGQHKDQLDVQRHELANVQQRLAASSVQQHEAECAGLQAQIEAADAAIGEAREKEKAAAAKAADLQAKLSDASGYRERELKAATEAMRAAQKRSESSAKSWTQREREYETLQLQIEDLRGALAKSTEQLALVQQTAEQAAQRLADLAGTAAEIGERVAALRAQIKQKRDALGAQSRELRALGVRKEKLAQSTQTLQLEIKKRQKEIEKLQSDNREGFERLHAMEEQYAWIEEDRKFFGAKNTRYDYGKTNPDEARARLRQAQQQKKELERNLNQKAMMMLEREEQQFKSMADRKQIVGDDKKKIKSIIVDLDDQKKIKVKAAFESVSEYFGDIFGSLLPGAMAKLVPAQPTNFMAGLIVRVGFNGMWKESLNELSGGQRSLVALSLILAMLKYKPAPLYILDEVDAALDMSHTQNIGKMLKMHFTNSQFIIVSLKDGMFNNANVLFKTKFENGVSGVVRTVAANMAR